MATSTRSRPLAMTLPSCTGDVLAWVRAQQGGEELVEGPSLAIPRTLRRVAGLDVRGREDDQVAHDSAHSLGH
jgi:hypothetical protein